MEEQGEIKNSKVNKKEVFAKMNASAERMLSALGSAYQAGMKEGITDEEEDQLIELLRRAKVFCDNIKKITIDREPDK